MPSPECRTESPNPHGAAQVEGGRLPSALLLELSAARLPVSHSLLHLHLAGLLGSPRSLFI